MTKCNAAKLTYRKDGFMERFVLSLLTSSVTMTAVAFVYMLLSKILREHWSAKWRYYTWVLIFFGFIMPYKLSFGNAAVNFNTQQQTVGVGNGHYTLPNESFDFFRMMFIVWALGAALFAAKTLMEQQSFVRSVKRLSHPVDEKTDKLIDGLTDELLIWQRVKAVRVKEISTPMIIGFFAPTVILPQKDFGEEELKLILKHELMHFKSRDLFIKAFMLAAQAVNWFNPFLKLFMIKAEQECEMYCDERVMAGESEYRKRLYCRSILNTAAADEDSGLRPVISTGFNISREGMKRRLKTILSVKKKYKLSIVCGAVAVMIILTGTVFAFSDNNDDGEGYAAYTSTYATAVQYNEHAVSTTTFSTVYVENF